MNSRTIPIKSDTDALQSELAALREELASRNEVIAMKAREVVEAQTAVTGWATKCKAAEQRNAELERDARRYQLLRDDPVTDRIISLMGDGLCGSMLDAAIDDLKPTESGASE
jgi:hypothetical protein